MSRETATHPTTGVATEEPQRYTESLAAIGQVLGAIVHGAFELEDVLTQIADQAVRMTRADYSYVYVRDGDVYRLTADSGGTAEFSAWEREHPNVPGRNTCVGRVVLERRAVHIPDVLADPEYTWLEAQQMAGYRTILGLPIEAEEDLIGVIGVARNRVHPFSDAEIATVSVFAQQTGVAVRLAGLFETVERQRTELARFAPQVASLISSDEGRTMLAGHRREITALFCDLRGFTSFAETAEPEEVLGVLREYHAAVGDIVVEHGGTVEHFAGDGLMVFFNDPAPQPSHRSMAIRSALAMRDRFASLADRWHRLGYELGLGIGISVGYATIGRMGFEGRYDYGAVGNVVILASRLSEAAAPGQILVSQRLFAAVEDEFEAAQVEPPTLKGFSRPGSVYNIITARS